MGREGGREKQQSVSRPLKVGQTEDGEGEGGRTIIGSMKEEGGYGGIGGIGGIGGGAAVGSKLFPAELLDCTGKSAWVFNAWNSYIQFIHG